MSARRESRVTMYMVVRKFLSKNSALLSELPSFDTKFNELTSCIALIDEVLTELELDKKGVAQDKKEKRKVVEVMAMDISLSLKVFADYTKTKELKNEVDFTKTELLRSADTVFRDRCRIIIKRAKENLSELAAFQVTEEVVADFEKALEDYIAYIPLTRITIASRKEYTRKINQLEETIDGILDGMDLLMEMLQIRQPEIYYEYKSSRKVIYTGKRFLAGKGKVLDKQSGEVIKGATICFFALNENEKLNASSSAVLEKRSAVKGGFFIKSNKCAYRSNWRLSNKSLL